MSSLGERGVMEGAIAAMWKSRPEIIRHALLEVITLSGALAQEQELEAIDRLTKGVAHDLNNLLTVISASLDFLQRRGPFRRESRALTKPITETAKQATTLTSPISALARTAPGAGSVPCRRQAYRPKSAHHDGRLLFMQDRNEITRGRAGDRGQHGAVRDYDV